MCHDFEERGVYYTLAMFDERMGRLKASDAVLTLSQRRIGTLGCNLGSFSSAEPKCTIKSVKWQVKVAGRDQ